MVSTYSLQSAIPPSLLDRFHWIGSHLSIITPSIHLPGLSLFCISNHCQQNQTLVLVTTQQESCSFSQIPSSELPFPKHTLSPQLPTRSSKPTKPMLPSLGQFPISTFSCSLRVSRPTHPSWSPGLTGSLWPLQHLQPPTPPSCLTCWAPKSSHPALLLCFHSETARPQAVHPPTATWPTFTAHLQASIVPTCSNFLNAL